MKLFLNIFLIIFLAWNMFNQAGERFRTTKGKVSINASTPLEDIEAQNHQVNAILNPATGKFAVVMLIRDFEFKRKLMQEHFNENYMESDKYPKATFSGTIENFEFSNLSTTASEYSIKGRISIHGITRQLNTNIRLSLEDDEIEINSNFVIRPEDHEIEVPKIVFQKIAQEVEVAVKLNLSTN